MRQIVYIVGISLIVCQFLPSCQTNSTEKEKLTADNIEDEVKDVPTEKVAGMAFNGIKDSLKKILHKPFFGKKEINGRILTFDQERAEFLNSDKAEFELSNVPTDTIFKIGSKVWIIPINNLELYGKQDEIILPKSQANIIKSIKLVKNEYNYDGGDIALEINFSETIQDNNGWYLMLNKELESKKWSRRNEIAKLSKDCKSKILNLNEGRIRPLLDLDGDNQPEFYVPYSDSNEGNLISICNSKNPINISFNSGH